ncbi:DUF4157 domain-containing protein [Cupriavidus necator]|nr:DUF4157 domain-containing protein [Cupriavidus necator]
MNPGRTQAPDRVARGAERAADAPAPAATHSAHAARLQPTGDNLALQALYASGELRARLTVGAADDPLEAQADRMADAALAGTPAGCTCNAGEPPCPACQAGAAAGIRRKPRGPDPPPPQPSAPLLGSGRALGAAERAMFETSYGADLSEVRIHDNPQAAGSAARLNARAFSLGTCIAFGAGEYQPHTASGRHLLGHELAHVAQGHGGIRRQTGPSMTPVDANASFAPPAEALQSSMAGPAHVEHATDFNPCAVDVRALTNYQLLAEYSHALSVVNRGRGADGYFDYRNLQRRLIAERDRRVDLGHAWLATMPSALPEQLYHIVDGEAGSFQVVAVPGTLAAGAPDRGALPLMTRDQFDRFLLTHNVERVNAHTFQLRMFGSAPESGGLGSTMAAGGLYNRPVDMLRLFSPPRFRPKPRWYAGARWHHRLTALTGSSGNRPTCSWT